MERSAPPSRRSIPGTFLRSIAAVAAALTMAACGPSAAPAASAMGPKADGIHFIEDDYSAALARARAEKKLLVLEAWAPWCHTCRSMQAFVFPSPRLNGAATRFVWLSVDTERTDANAAVLARHPISVWPTLLVIEPVSGAVVARWQGGLSDVELVAFLDDAEASGASGSGVEGGGESATLPALLLQAERAATQGPPNDAVVAYRAAWEARKGTATQRARALEGFSSALYRADTHANCTQLVALTGETLADRSVCRGEPGVRSPLLAAQWAAATYALACVERDLVRAPSDAGTIERARTLLSWTDSIATSVRSDATECERGLADDRSSVFEARVSLRRALGDPTGARDEATRWAAFLEAEAGRATSPTGRTVFDAHRLAAYLELGVAERAIPMLHQSERDFPTDYNPPARLARAYLALGKLQDAGAAADRALARVYGPRALRVYALRADICEKAKDLRCAREVLTKGLASTERLPLSPTYAKVRFELTERLRKLEALR